MLRNKRILITAGPTWVPIDSVRVISNIATGESGILLAEAFREKGAKVTLLLGPSGNRAALDKKISVLRFRFFDELQDKLSIELKKNKYSIVIHTAAVADYKPKKIYRSKISSGIPHLRLELVPTSKIIDCIKRISPEVFVVGFKFEPKVGKEALIKEAQELIIRSGVDLVVANSVVRNKYRAYLVSKEDWIYGPLFSKKQVADKVSELAGERVNRLTR